jgi:hypothetical protein
MKRVGLLANQILTQRDVRGEREGKPVDPQLSPRPGYTARVPPPHPPGENNNTKGREGAATDFWSSLRICWPFRGHVAVFLSQNCSCHQPSAVISLVDEVTSIVVLVVTRLLLAVKMSQRPPQVEVAAIIRYKGLYQ